MKKCLSLILILCIIAYSYGCIHSKKMILKDDLTQYDRIDSVVLIDGNLIKFDKEGGWLDERNMEVLGLTTDQRTVQIKQSEILYVNVVRVDGVKTFLVIIGISAAVVLGFFLIALATKQSCPFIYSFDGDTYVFDAEPLGGAICKALQRSDFSRLEHLKPYDGKYLIKLTNEVDEIQYIDKFHLEYVDLRDNSEIIKHWTGSLYAVDEVIAPISATDGSGTDYMKFFSSIDGIMWQTKLPLKEIPEYDSLWHQIKLTYEKPQKAQDFKLVFKGGTSLLGSQMVRDVTQLYGSVVENYFQSLYNPEILKRREQYMFHDNIYYLDVYVKEGKDYVKRGYLPHGGPFDYDIRLVDLDLSNHNGDTIELLIKPPRAFWVIDFIGLTSSYKEVKSMSIYPNKANLVKSDLSIMESIMFSDSIYHVMPLVGDEVDFEFDVPYLEDGYIRTVFGVTDGYYKMNLDTNASPDFETLLRVGLQPGEIIRFALERYNKYLETWQGKR